MQTPIITIYALLAYIGIGWSHAILPTEVDNFIGNSTTVEEVETISDVVAQRSMFLDALEWCESRGNPNAINEDDGGSRSVGILQFKDTTFQHYSNFYNLKYSPNDIWNPDKQRILASHMLLDGLEHHWKNCHTIIGEDYPK